MIYTSKITVENKEYTKVLVTRADEKINTCSKVFFIKTKRYREIESLFKVEKFLKKLYEFTIGDSTIDVGKSLITNEHVIIQVKIGKE